MCSEKISTACRAVVFDLDGTLLNTLADLAQSVNHVLQQYGYPTHRAEQYKQFIGNGVTKLIERALPEAQRTPEHIAQLQVDYIAYYACHDKDHTAPYPGVVELLERLKQQGLTLAVASNKHHEATADLVAHYFGTQTFAAVYGQRAGVAPKPDPTIVLDIMAQCGVSANEVLYVGDSGTDMQTAKNASVCSVGVTWGFRSRQELSAHHATYLIDKPMELLEVLGL